MTQSRGFAKIVLISGIVGGLPGLAWANDGYFQIGYGMSAIGMGGTAIAVTQSGLTGANNPATASFTANQADFGLYLFKPDRSASRSDNEYGLNGGATSGSTLFPIPEFGFNEQLNDRFAVGLTLYGNGGLDTAYPGGQIPANHCGPGAPASNLLCGGGTLGVDITQVVLAPTLSWKVTPAVSIGVAPQVAIQQFTAYGLQAFTGVSASPNNLTGRGFSYSEGLGVRIGAYWQVTPALSAGLTYQTPVYSTGFSKYDGLFAGRGSFDIPATLGAGMAFRPAPGLLIAADYARIFYSDIPAIANASESASALGADHGPGFGWHSVNVAKFGVQYQFTPALALRAGYNYSGNPVTPANVTFNILAPGVTQHHLTFGGTYTISPHSAFTLAYAHAFANSVSGPTSPLLPGGGTDTVRLAIDAAGWG